MSDSLPPDTHPEEHDDIDQGVPTTHEAAQFVDTVLPPKPGHPMRRIILWVLLVLVLVAAAVVIYLLLLKPKPAAAPNTSTNSNQSTPTQSTTQTATVPTTSYTSSNYNLSFNYPTGWNVNDPTGGKLTVISPVSTLTAADGQSVNGKVIMTIQNQQTTLPDFTAGDATAVLDSQRVAYSKPTSNQRANTYLSYLQYAATTTTGALDGIYVTGDFGYQKGQNVPLSDITKVNPLITVSFLKCSEAQCSSSSALSVQASSWSKNPLATTTQNMLESLAIN